jgi:hypothetical protein
MVRTIDNIYYGRITHFSTERLLDVLNQGSKGDQPDLPADCLQLYDVVVRSIVGQKTTLLLSCLIKKGGILFISQNKTPSRDNVLAHPGRPSPFIPKKVVSVEIHLPSLLITGEVHLHPWQRSTGVFNDDRRFLPVTGARISSVANAGTGRFEFLAVNREQINCVANSLG